MWLKTLVKKGQTKADIGPTQLSLKIVLTYIFGEWLFFHGKKCRKKNLSTVNLETVSIDQLRATTKLFRVAFVLTMCKPGCFDLIGIEVRR